MKMRHGKLISSLYFEWNVDVVTRYPSPRHGIHKLELLVENSGFVDLKSNERVLNMPKKLRKDIYKVV